MLGKLIKYEWKSTYKVGIILLLALGMATLIGCLAFQAPMWREIRSQHYYIETMGMTMMNVVSVFSFILYILLLTGAVYAIFIYLVVHFYKSMYTDEGYLLHTLPVTKNQILVSKILVSVIWVFLIYIGLMLSIFIFLLVLVSVATGENVFIIMRELTEILGELKSLFSVLFEDLEITWTVVASIINLILGVPMAVIIMFGAVSLGQLFSKHRILMAILSYVCILIFRWVVHSIIQGISWAGMMSSTTGHGFFDYTNMTLYSNLILELLLTVGCYLASYFITSKKLNME